MPSFPFFRFPYQNQYYPYYTNYNRPIIQNNKIFKIKQEL